MLKRIIAIMSATLLLCSTSVAFDRGWIGTKTNIFNTNINSTINWTDNMENPLNDWAFWIVNWEWWNGQLSWLVWTDQKITDYSNALSKILKTIQNIVNYALWLIGVIALIYMIVHGFMILTAAWDDGKVKKWFKWIKNALLAISWIWLSWIIISFIIWLIKTLTA